MTLEALEAAFRKFRQQIACVIVEPVVGNMGCVPPDPFYLDALREITQRDKMVLIFDEVMTGFRLAFGGAQERYGIRARPDDVGKDHRRRLAGGRLWRAVGNHGHGRAARPGVSGRHAVWKSAGHGRRPGDSALPAQPREQIYTPPGTARGQLAEGVAAAAKEAVCPCAATASARCLPGSLRLAR